MTVVAKAPCDEAAILSCRRRFIFGAASAWCGLSRTIGELIAARALHVGAALLVPGSLALIGASFPATCC